MRVFIVSYNRADIISTHKLLPDTAEWKVVLHDEQQKADYVAAGMDADRIVVTGITPSKIAVGKQKQWVEDNLTTEGEWYGLMDDNIDTFREYERYDEDKHTATELAGKHWHREIEGEALMKRLEQCAQLAENVGAGIVGFATTDNPFFRKKHYSHAAFIIGKAMVKKSGTARYSGEVQMEDFEITAEHLLKYGIVVRDNWIKPSAKHYQKGGIGSMESRVEQRRKDAVILTERYPNLFRIIEKKNQPIDLRLRVTEETVGRWRYVTTMRKRQQAIMEGKGKK